MTTEQEKQSTNIETQLKDKATSVAKMKQLLDEKQRLEYEIRTMGKTKG